MWDRGLQLEMKLMEKLGAEERRLRYMAAIIKMESNTFIRKGFSPFPPIIIF